MSVVNSQVVVPKPGLRWYQYSLRTLLVVVTLFAIACSWFGGKLQAARRQREAVAVIEKVQGHVAWSAGRRRPGCGFCWAMSIFGR